MGGARSAAVQQGSVSAEVGLLLPSAAGDLGHLASYKAFMPMFVQWDYDENPV